MEQTDELIPSPEDPARACFGLALGIGLGVVFGGPPIATGGGGGVPSNAITLDDGTPITLSDGTTYITTG